MGQQIECTVESAGRKSQGLALLESNEIVFRGDFRLRIPRAAIKNVAASDGKLEIEWPEGSAIFHSGTAASHSVAKRWAARISNPPSRVDKLGIKPGMSFRAIGRLDQDFLAELKERGANPRKENADVVFLAANLKSALDQMPGIAAGALWIVYPKGLQAITEKDVLVAGRAAGLVDVKVAAFSATHTALKFVPARHKAEAAG